MKGFLNTYHIGQKDFKNLIDVIRQSLIVISSHGSTMTFRISVPKDIFPKMGEQAYFAFLEAKLST